MNKKKEHYEIASDNIFADIGLDQSDEILAKAKLLHAVGLLIKASGLTQKEIAERLNITQPKVSMLLSGKLSAFSYETLIHYLTLMGCSIQIKVSKPRSKIGIFRHKGLIAVS